jgi:hypothetical protein
MDIHLMDPSLHDDSAIHKTQKNVQTNNLYQFQMYIVQASYLLVIQTQKYCIFKKNVVTMTTLLNI